MIVSAKNPITTLGTLASVSRIGFSQRRARGEAYSARYRAAPSPSGTATIMAIAATISVPATIVLMSKRLLRGNHPSDQRVARCTLRRKSSAPPARLTTIPTLITTDRKAAEKNRPRITRSRRSLAGFPRRTSTLMRLGTTAWAMPLLPSYVLIDARGSNLPGPTDVMEPGVRPGSIT